MIRPCSLVILLSLGIVACATPAPRSSSLPVTPEATFRATVASVHDGDTVTVSANGSLQKIRLNGIDCPETDQPWGPQATEFTRGLADKQEVIVTDFGRDKYQRIIGLITLTDGRNLNQELVRQGFCWWYQKYAQSDAVLKQLEQQARDAKRGLWIDANPIPPWDWRRKNNYK